MTEAGLKRRIGPGLMTAYGVGVMVGAGIYVLIGAVAGLAGSYAPLAFLLAGLVAAPSALTYAELSARIPEAAGEAAYVAQAFGTTLLPVAIGLAIVLAGTVSGAAVLRGGVGYLTALVSVTPVWAIVAIGAALTLVAIAGVLESLALAALFTVVEVIGLVLVSGAGLMAEPVAVAVPEAAPGAMAVLAATALAFFAFIGFEDVVNMAEEAREPERTMPRAIIASLLITAVLYALVSFAALRAVPAADLAASERPLALVWERATGQGAGFLAAIAVLAALNGVLAQLVMAARVLFGLGRRARAFAPFTHAHPRFGTPVLASLTCGAALIGAALALPVAQLAEIASMVLLAVFAAVNTSLIALKLHSPQAPFRVPMVVPVVGLVAALAALGLSLAERIAP
ncbi:APC family permease [Vannielia litorea]|uniref:APC family permease n=1 Tax=Vannielia litorea TaxID=1217970 RepID=UPI001C93C778|nr:APC family permease [Vannielia litorea]MBY6153270.1 APC family permease [Vannielia litorea]